MPISERCVPIGLIESGFTARIRGVRIRRKVLIIGNIPIFTPIWSRCRISKIKFSFLLYIHMESQSSQWVRGHCGSYSLSWVSGKVILAPHHPRQARTRAVHQVLSFFLPFPIFSFEFSSSKPGTRGKPSFWGPRPEPGQAVRGAAKSTCMLEYASCGESIALSFSSSHLGEYTRAW